MSDRGQLSLNSEARLRFQQGLAFVAAAEYGKAVANYNLILQSQSDCWEVWYERGLALEYLGNYQEAIASYDTALELPLDDTAAAEVWHNKGNALQYGLGNFQAALASYNTALQLCPRNALAWLNRGNVLLYGLNRCEEAVASYDRALEINPNDDLAWRNRGNALVELGRHPEAIASYDQAIALKPNDQATWQARSCALTNLGVDPKKSTTNPTWYGEGYWEANPSHGEKETVLDQKISEALDAPTTASPTTNATPSLVIKDNQGKRQMVLEEACYSIGRDSENDIRLHSQFASRYHATLIQLPNEDGTYSYMIKDGNLKGKHSTNGLIINGRRCQSWNLKHEDSIIFGPNVWAVYLSVTDDNDSSNALSN